jgi:hypothetical protein
MKDSEARDVINLLTKRVRQLEQELAELRNPHQKGCKCVRCSGWKPDYFLVQFDRGYAAWWIGNSKEASS